MAEQLNVLVTGATGGIGRSTALQLAWAGHRVFATGRRMDALTSLLSDVGKGSLDVLRLDVNDRSSIQSAKDEIDRVTDGYGIDVLVNNAGFGLFAPLELIDDSDMRSQFETNVFGLMSVTQAFLPGMRKRGFGHIINVSSILGRFSLPLEGLYCATKHAVEAISDALRREVAGFGVNVVIVEPGMIRTGFDATAGATVSKYGAEGSPYAEPMKRFQAMATRMYRTAPGPEVITALICRIVRTRNPKARYVRPLKDALSQWFLRLLPVRLVDFVVRKLLGLGRR